MRCQIIISGAVQGIGFRPFVYNIAIKYGLKGFVLNRGDAGVEIQVEGKKEKIESFINDLQRKKPNLAKYDSFKINYNIFDNELDSYKTFKIADSKSIKGTEASYIPPDLPICEKCLSEMKHDSRRLSYAFTSCVDCGPRYTVIKSLPYDRPRTVMEDFPLCNECIKEYTSPSNRRFHAQTTCCWSCGPRYYVVDNDNNIIIDKNAFRVKWTEFVKLFNEDKIIAIKGIGGTHIACNTISDDPILKLRQWKGGRGEKPFAVMAANIERIREFAQCSSREADYLSSVIRPILLLTKLADFPLSRYISPGLHNIGVLLPYAGIHDLIMNNISSPALIMTSGNPSNLPILISNEKIKKNLSSIADYFLLHDREIYQRADDSVMRLHIVDSQEYPLIIRRSRGFVPEPIQLPWIKNASTVLALGAEMYAVGAIGLGKRCFPTQYIGHLTTIENLDFLEASINHMKNLLGIKEISGIGSDLHPQFLSTKMAETLASELKIPFFQFQHHYSHLSALAVDSNISPEEEIICVSLDGTGYGEDGTIWGGEILVGNYSEYKRIAHLEHQILLGGDEAILQPYRILLAYLSKKLPIEEITCTLNEIPWLSWITKEIHYNAICSQLDKYQKPGPAGKHLYTSSCGRLLDTISILLGASKFRSYEGEPAIKLESFAEKALNKQNGPKLILGSKDLGGGIIQIQTTNFIFDILEKIKAKMNPNVLALAAEKAIAEKFALTSIELAERHGITKIGLSGGVSYNQVIFKHFYNYIKAYNTKISPISHKNIPCGDGGISIGQVPLIQAKLL